MADTILAVAAVCGALIGIGIFVKKLVSIASIAIANWSAMRTLVNAQLRPNSGSSLVDRVRVSAESAQIAKQGVTEVKDALRCQDRKIDRMTSALEGYRRDADKRDRAIDRTLGEIMGTLDEMRRRDGTK